MLKSQDSPDVRQRAESRDGRPVTVVAGDKRETKVRQKGVKSGTNVRQKCQPLCSTVWALLRRAESRAGWYAGCGWGTKLAYKNKTSDTLKYKENVEELGNNY